jgi:divalent metal cation (Fe/Co/Zn/Cd) transporter
MNDKKNGQPGWKRWHLKSRVVLMLLGAIAVIVYLFQAGLAKQYAGLGAALCAVSLGLFLVWHAIHVFTEEDTIEEQQINKAAASSSQLNPADKEQS